LYRVEIRSLSRKVHVITSTRNSDRVRINGRRLSPFVSRIRRDRFSSNLNLLAGLKVEISGELREGEGARLFSGDVRVASAVGDRIPAVHGVLVERISNQEFDFTDESRLARDSPRDLDSRSVSILEERDLDGLNNWGNPVGGEMLVSVNSNGGDKDVSSAEVSVGVHDVEDNESSP
jgi:hypothetical protein